MHLDEVGMRRQFGFHSFLRFVVKYWSDGVTVVAWCIRAKRSSYFVMVEGAQRVFPSHLVFRWTQQSTIKPNRKYTPVPFIILFYVFVVLPLCQIYANHTYILLWCACICSHHLIYVHVLTRDIINNLHKYFI